MAEYDILTYLLDKQNAEDTIQRMVLALDEGDSDTLVNLAYTPEITLNFDKNVAGNGPETLASSEWAKRVDQIHAAFDTTQHLLQNVLVNLPQPNAGSVRPEQCTAFAYCTAVLYNRDTEGLPRVLAKRNGVHFNFDLVRLKDEEAHGGNPWRIKTQNVRLDWQEIA